MAFTNEQIKSAYDASVAQGHGWDDILAGANRYGISPEQLRAAGVYAPGTNQFTGTQVHATNANQTYNYDDLVQRANGRYSEGKTPALVAKSGIQLGLPEDVIMSLPGMTQEHYAAGKNLIDSGAFAPTATGTEADGYKGGFVDPNTPQAKARAAAGLDVYGHPLGATSVNPELSAAEPNALMQTLGGAGTAKRNVLSQRLNGGNY